ncbi:hypothetical protein Q7P37_010035 [Cladosporium fusiforme]
MVDALSVMVSFPREDTATLSPSEYDKQILAFTNSLGKLPAASWTKSVDKKSLLELLDPSVNSIPYLKALLDAVRADKKQERDSLELFYDQACIFFTSFDPVQVRFAGELWHDLWDWSLAYVHAFGIIDLTPLSTALLRLDPSAATFTTLHLRLVRQCLSLGTPTQALPILDQNIFAYPQTLPKGIPGETTSDDHEISNAFITATSGFSGKIIPEHVLEYYLLGAHVYIGTRNYQRARLFLECVLLYPTQQHITSHFQVEAYKKWVLIGLLSEGKPFPYPRTIDQGVWKNIKAVGKSYDSLADSFERRDFLKYSAEVDVGSQIWAGDGNMRLVEAAGRALVRYRVSDLQKTYAALPVSRVATHLGLSPADTLTTLTEMIRQSRLNASLAQGATPAEYILRFELAPAAGTASPSSDLESQTKRIESLIAAVRDADRRLQITKEHAAVTKRQKSVHGPDAELADQMDLSWDAPGTTPDVPLLAEDDEDIMS